MLSDRSCQRLLKVFKELPENEGKQIITTKKEFKKLERFINKSLCLFTSDFLYEVFLIHNLIPNAKAIQKKSLATLLDAPQIPIDWKPATLNAIHSAFGGPSVMNRLIMHNTKDSKDVPQCAFSVRDNKIHLSGRINELMNDQPYHVVVAIARELDKLKKLTNEEQENEEEENEEQTKGSLKEKTVSTNQVGKQPSSPRHIVASGKQLRNQSLHGQTTGSDIQDNNGSSSSRTNGERRSGIQIGPRTVTATDRNQVKSTGTTTTQDVVQRIPVDQNPCWVKDVFSGVNGLIDEVMDHMPEQPNYEYTLTFSGVDVRFSEKDANDMFEHANTGSDYFVQIKRLASEVLKVLEFPESGLTFCYTSLAVWGYASNQKIFVNLRPLMLPRRYTLKEVAVFLALVISHGLAHLLLQDEGHGARHGKLTERLMMKLLLSNFANSLALTTTN